MITIDALKLNKFQQVTIPKPSELFARFGMSSKKGNYTGDEAAPMGQSKVETLAEVQKVAVEKE